MHILLGFREGEARNPLIARNPTQRHDSRIVNGSVATG